MPRGFDPADRRDFRNGRFLWLALAAALLFVSGRASAQCCACFNCAGSSFCVDELMSSIECAELCDQANCQGISFEVADSCAGGCDGQVDFPTATISITPSVTPTASPSDTPTTTPTASETLMSSPKTPPRQTPTPSQTPTVTPTVRLCCVCSDCTGGQFCVDMLPNSIDCAALCVEAGCTGINFQADDSCANGCGEQTVVPTATQSNTPTV